MTSPSPPTDPKEEDKTDGKKEDLWDQIGFHKPLGGYLYNYVLGFVGLVFALVIGGLLISLLYPYPESKGYRDLSRMMFVWIMPIFDMGVAYGIERFIGEWRVKDQRVMVEYISFFTWYQLLSSCMKTTIFSWLTFTMIRDGELAYLSWNILFLAIQHYPGFLYLLRSCMAGLQHYHKASLLNTLGSEVFDKLFLLIFIFMWRNIGNTNPSLGELMTISFGTTFAYYMRDFFMFAVQIWVIRPILKPMGITLKELFIPRFSKQVVKTAFKAGLSVTGVSLLGQGIAYAMTMMYVDSISAYTTFIVLSGSATSFINFIDFFGKVDITTPFSEAYRNGKNKLSLFYVAQGLKYWGWANGAMMCMFAAFLGVLSETLLSIPGLGNYALIGIFMMPSWIYKFFLPLAEQGDTILVSAMRLKVYQMVRILEEVIKVVWVVLLLYVFKWQLMGSLAIAYVLIFAVAVPQWIKTVIVWIYIRRHLLAYTVPVWQAIAAPLLAGLVNFGIITLYLTYVHPIYLPALGPLVAGIITIVIVLLVFPNILFPFFYGLLGGWDDFGLATFQKAMTIAGPSKIFYRLGEKLTVWAARHSPLTNRFPIPHADAIEEIKSLTEMKKQAQKI